MDPPQRPRRTVSSSEEVDGQPISSTGSETSLDPVDGQFPNCITPSGRSAHISSSGHESHGWSSSGNSGIHSHAGYVQNVPTFLQGSSSGRMDNNDGGGRSSGVVFRHDNNCSGPASSLDGWGSSCKRKALEGASGHGLPHYDGSRCGPGGRRAVGSNDSPSTRNPLSWMQDSVPFSLSSAEISAPQHLPVTTPSGIPSCNESQSNIIHLPVLTRNIQQFARNNSPGIVIRGGRFGLPPDVPRRNPEYHLFRPSTEMRNPMPDQSTWSFSRGNPRPGMSSSIPSFQPIPAWILSRSGSTHNPSRTSELAPSSLFSSIGSESASRGGPLPSIRTGPSVPWNEAAAMPSGSSGRSHHRPWPRRSGLASERQNDLRHLQHLGRSLSADIDRRNQLMSEILQVLNAMQQEENIPFEDDPFMYRGTAEVHDRHRDMRLDVDSMSYEGNV
ncbi:PREDICTED: E3 ubiquitin-protein ligase MBR2-like isoform X2 [Tarenaya hassleriana]|uniref:E3 ubiquitin-protein ligase MBR2-like isoform X2 n=1 Tax=Tarenaya hassleriana TaxID=28532 RepID=UPI00053C755E|nr:PREDICTED: E3 ubiquitin-protein ligase MBR2-like isoform X2 [Tarenaya hassleriana]